MYSSLAEYRQAYKKVELRYVLMAKQREGAAYLKNNLSVERGYAVYQNALNKPHLRVIGTLSISTSIDLKSFMGQHVIGNEILCLNQT